jgi:hypothetical protein
VLADDIRHSPARMIPFVMTGGLCRPLALTFTTGVWHKHLLTQWICKKFQIPSYAWTCYFCHQIVQHEHHQQVKLIHQQVIFKLKYQHKQHLTKVYFTQTTWAEMFQSTLNQHKLNYTTLVITHNILLTNGFRRRRVRGHPCAAAARRWIQGGSQLPQEGSVNGCACCCKAQCFECMEEISITGFLINLGPEISSVRHPAPSSTSPTWPNSKSEAINQQCRCRCVSWLIKPTNLYFFGCYC